MRKDATFWITLVSVAIIVFILQFVLKNTPLRTPTVEELKASVKTIPVKSQWTYKYRTAHEVRIVPEITFKIKNTGKKPIQYLIANVIFEIEGLNQELGNGWKPIITKKPLAPGKISEPITIKSGFGYRASSVKAFYNNYNQWKRCWATIFIKWNGSQYAKFGVYEIKKYIKGVKIVTNEAVTVEK
jgi:hypothetical protein